MSAADHRECNCAGSHPTFNSLAQCIWPDAEWVLGEGPFASLRACHGLTVLLHPTKQEAESALNKIHGCDRWKLVVLHAEEDLL